MSRRGKLLAATLLALTAASVMAPSADAAQTRRERCDPLVWWFCGSGSTDQQVGTPARKVRVPVTHQLDYTDPRDNPAMRDAGGGGGGGGGGR